MLLFGLGALTTNVDGQEMPLDRSINALEKSLDYVNEALNAMVLANATGNEAAFQRYLSDASFSVAQGLKWCERGRAAFVETAAHMKAKGCDRSHAMFMKGDSLIRSSASELTQSEANFTGAVGAKNPYYIRRMHDEAAAHIASALRFLRSANEEMEEGVMETKQCVH